MYSLFLINTETLLTCNTTHTSIQMFDMKR